MAPIRILIHGCLGKMGQAVSAGLAADKDFAIVGGVDTADVGETYSVAGKAVPYSRSIAPLLEATKPAVVVDFSTAEATLPVVRAAAARGASFVVGTTGHKPEAVAEMETLAQRHHVGGALAPNFALGAVLLMHLASKAAPFFDYAEIIELHHETKIDAPSGTAAATARQMANAKGRAFKRNVPSVEALAGTRGNALAGVTIHSVRLPGMMAHQEVIFGIAGQTLTLRHDTINRDCYVPGIAIAVRYVAANQGRFVQGLDRLMGLT